MDRSRCGCHRSIANNPHGHKQICVRDMQQRVSKGPELTTPSPWPQPSMEAEATVQQRGDKEESIHMSYQDLCPP